jgi:hypothetical protein
MERNWHEALVVFHDDPGETSQRTRSEHLTRRRAASEQHRSELLARLSEAGLEHEVELTKATPLTSLMVKGSPRALEEIDKAPIVKRVMPIPADATFRLIDE